MRLELTIQKVIEQDDIPSKALMKRWVLAALNEVGFNQNYVEMTVRVVTQEESQQLNFDYRSKNKPTNILSFPFESPEHIPSNLLGDLVICFDVVAEEAAQQNKKLFDHWAHLLIHGSMHLLGFDHQQDDEALEMENHEINTLKKLNISNPYLN